MSQLSAKIGQTLVTLVLDDITRCQVDAIVNAANPTLMGGGGVDGAIHRAGGPQILAECKEIRRRQGDCPTGEAVITSGGNLPARHVIHTVGPVWHGGNKGEASLLAAAYRNSLALAAARQLKTVAFPAISTGIYGYPVAQAARTALDAIGEFCQHCQSLTEVRIVLFDQTNLAAWRQALSALIAAGRAQPPA